MSTPIPAPAPQVTPETAPFWEATAQGKLLLRHCNDCGSYNWYPRTICPECSSLNTSWVESSGQGEVYSYTLNTRGDGPYKDSEYVLAYVQLDEGPRIMTNIVDSDPADIAVGSRVSVVFHDTGEGNALYRFTLV
jgi:uncharacterized protein